MRASAFCFQRNVAIIQVGAQTWMCHDAGSNFMRSGGALAVTRQENGGIDTTRFMEWGYTFVDYFESLTANGQNVLLIHNGFQAHLSLSILELFERNTTIAYVSPALTSGKTQPLDVVLFSVFKDRLQDAVSSCAAPGSGQLYDVFDLCSMIRRAYEQSFNASNIQASFYW